MRPLHLLGAAAVLATISQLPVVGAPAPSATQIVRGAARTEKAPDRKGDWLVATDSEATVRTKAGVFRLTQGSALRLQAKANVVDTRGRVFCKLQSNDWVKLSTGKRSVVARQGEFVLDSSHDGQLRVFEGEVFADKEQRGIFRTAAVDWTDEPVALDGPDVRKGNRNRKKFTQGEENKGKRIGEDAPPTQTPSPVASQTPTPSYTPPSPSPSFTPPSPSPTKPPDPPADADAGADIGPIIGGVVGAGGLAAFLILRDDGDASP